MATHTEMTQKTKAALRKAAIDAIYELGYQKTTGVEIVRRAGVTRGALQHHYPRGKIDVFMDVLNTYFQQRNKTYHVESLSYETWFAGRMQYFQQSFDDEKDFRTLYAIMSITIFFDVEGEEREELRHAYEQNYRQNLSIREKVISGTEQQKSTILPIYQFLHVFFTGYMMHRNRLSELGHADGALEFAQELLEVWKNHTLQQQNVAPGD